MRCDVQRAGSPQCPQYAPWQAPVRPLVRPPQPCPLCAAFSLCAVSVPTNQTTGGCGIHTAAVLCVATVIRRCHGDTLLPPRKFGICSVYYLGHCVPGPSRARGGHGTAPPPSPFRLPMPMPLHCFLSCCPLVGSAWRSSSHSTPATRSWRSRQRDAGYCTSVYRRRARRWTASERSCCRPPKTLQRRVLCCVHPHVF